MNAFWEVIAFNLECRDYLAVILWFLSVSLWLYMIFLFVQLVWRGLRR